MSGSRTCASVTAWTSCSTTRTGTSTDRGCRIRAAEYTDAQLAHAEETQRFRGIVLDEVEHRQIHHIDCGPGPYLADVQGKNLEQCYEALLKNVASIAERYRKHGGATIAEQVFPDLSHVFARAGVAPAPKFLSFSYWPVYFAVAAGAAKQYGTELWVVHDFWGAEPFWGEMARSRRASPRKRIGQVFCWRTGWVSMRPTRRHCIILCYSAS